MRKVVLIPDSFKGTMSSSEICNIMSDSIHKFYPEAQVVSVPVADGGEGSVDAFLTAMGGQKVTVEVAGPFMEKMSCYYGIIDESKTAVRTAVIEMAACAGLPLVEGKADPRKTTTYGVGELMLHAAKNGCKRIIMGLGGSSTNDGGTGAAAAAGAVFTDKEGKEFIPVGGTLSSIAKIDVSKVKENFTGIEIITMCDIDNPLYGKTGAAYIFGPQKGADEKMVEFLDAELRAMCATIKSSLNQDLSELPGGGAAGGMGAGMKAFFDSELQMGIETVLNTVGFDELVKDADMVFTGEGKIDTQSIRGKVVIGVARRTKKYNVPLVAIVGDIGDGIEEAYDIGVYAVMSINRVAVDYKQARPRAKSDLALTMETVMRMRKMFAKEN